MEPKDFSIWFNRTWPFRIGLILVIMEAVLFIASFSGKGSPNGWFGIIGIILMVVYRKKKRNPNGK